MAVLLPDPRPAPPAPPRGARPAGLLVTAQLIAGTVATGAGAGHGVRHLQKTGLSIGTVAGLLALVVGLVLLGAGLATAWRALRRWWRLLLVPLVVLLLVPASSVGLAVAYTQVPPTALGDARPADHGLAATDLELRTADGVTLSAWWVPPRTDAAVVLLHGAGSTRTSVLPEAAVLARHGYGVLLLDARGHGRSGGTGTDLGWHGDADVTAAVDAALAQPGVRRVALVGSSMGGEQAIGAAAADPRVVAVVAEGATARTAEDKAAWLPGGVPGAVQRAVDRLTFGLTDLLTAASPPTALTDAVATAEGTPFLLVVAGRVPDERRAADALAAAGGDRVSVWEVPGAEHTGGLATDPAGWERRVTGFLDEALSRR